MARCSRSQSSARPARPALAISCALFVGDAVQTVAIGNGAAFADEPVEYCVHDRAAVHRPQFDDVFGLFHGIDVQARTA